MSAAPTFQSIPRAEVIAYRGKNAVEVPLKTALQYIRYLDTEEEKVNDVLRNHTNARREALEKLFREEATERVTAWPTLTENDVPDYDVAEVTTRVIRGS